MKQKTALLGAVAAVVFSSGAAFAAPVPAVPPGNKFISDNTFETLILCAADGTTSGAPGGCTGGPSNFLGVGLTNNVGSSLANAGRTYGFLPAGSGPPPPFLYLEFSGFTVRTIVAQVPLVSDGKILLTGGELNYYTFPTDQGIPNGSSAASQVAAIKLGTLWLGLKPACEDALCDTVIITIPKEDPIGTFAKSTAEAFLDVNLTTPGTAGPGFDHCGESNPFDVTNPPDGIGLCLGKSDISYNASGEANPDTGTNPPFGISGTQNLRQIFAPVPEPATLSLLGGGLIALAARRRRRKAKA